MRAGLTHLLGEPSSPRPCRSSRPRAFARTHRSTPVNRLISSRSFETSVSRKLVVGVGERARDLPTKRGARSARRGPLAAHSRARSRARSPTPTTSLRETDVRLRSGGSRSDGCERRTIRMLIPRACYCSRVAQAGCNQDYLKLE